MADDNTGTLKDIYIADGNAQPNILDNYSSYTYNITFSMLPMSFFHSGNFTLGTETTKDAGKVIIAQTGVTTKFNIDNLTIKTIADNYGSTFTSTQSITSELTFQITEPLGSSLIHLMYMGYNRLKEIDKMAGNTFGELYGDPKNRGPLDLPYLLEVDLIGHKPVGDQYDELEYETIGKYIFPTFLTAFDFNPETEGTQYNFRLQSVVQLSNTLIPETRRLGRAFTIKGKTTKELMDDLEAQLNVDIMKRLHLETAEPTAETRNRSHTIKLGLGSKWAPSFTTTEDFRTGWHEAVLPLDKGIAKKITKTVAKTDADAADGTGEKEDAIEAYTMVLKKGKLITEAMTDILSFNSVFVSMVSDFTFTNEKDSKGTPKEPGVPTYSPKPQKAAVVKASGHTITTGGPAMTITYTLDLAMQGGVDTGAANSTKTTEEQRKTLVDSWGIVKKYDYMFTGLNDQIQNVDISFAPGQVFLFPEFGGQAPTYQDSAAVARDRKEIETVKHKAVSRLTSGPLDVLAVLAHFEDLATDLRGIVSGIAQDGQEFITGLAAMRVGPVSGAIRLPNSRLPSSPQAVFAKGKAITQATQTADKLFTDLQDLQERVESAAGELQAGVSGGINLLTKRIGQIVTESMTPFNFKSSLNSVIGDMQEGIGGFVKNINDSTGLSLNTNDIPGLGEIDNLLGDIKDFVETKIPEGFETPSTGDASFGKIVYDNTAADVNIYLEEMDFSTKETDIEVAASITMKASGQPRAPADSDPAIMPKQHYMTTALSYGKTGIPYLSKLTMEIKGDPYWIGKRNYASEYNTGTVSNQTILRDGLAGAWTPEYITDYSDRSGAPYDAGSVFLAFRYVFPKEYETYQDNEDMHSGKIEQTRVDMSYTGYYLVTKVLHTFAQGIFKQNIDCVKMNTFPNTMIKGTPTDIQRYGDPDADDGSTAQAVGLQPDFGIGGYRDGGNTTVIGGAVNDEPPRDINAERQAFLDGFTSSPPIDPNDYKPKYDIGFVPNYSSLLNDDNGSGG